MCTSDQNEQAGRRWAPFEKILKFRLECPFGSKADMSTCPRDVCFSPRKRTLKLGRAGPPSARQRPADGNHGAGAAGAVPRHYTERLRAEAISGGRLYEEIEAVLFEDRLRCVRAQE